MYLPLCLIFSTTQGRTKDSLHKALALKMENARPSVECPKKMAVSGFLRKVSSKFWVCVCVL